MKLSKECIEAIDGLFPRYAMQRVAATEALTNPSIYSKAGLISLEDAFGFPEWIDESNYEWIPSMRIFVHDEDYDVNELFTTAQLFQIYQEQKEK